MYGIFELIVVWADGSLDLYEYPTKDEAFRAGCDMEIANGKQITWYGVRPKHS